VTAGYDATLRLWDLERAVARATLSGHTGAVLACAFTADGTILSGGEDKRVGLWRPT
jgi:WD40 repeat protein